MTLHWNEHAHEYQNKAAHHLFTRDVAVLWLDPGYGKTMTVLHAFKALLEAGKAKHMLVVAPLRVVQTVWAQEIENWSSLRGLVACRLHGPKKETMLARRDVNVWLINYEGMEWLAKMAKAGKVKNRFDVVVADEVRRFKEPSGVRFKAARPIFKLASYRWGLTGTPVSNGLTDLFGQFLILDQGRALGDRVTRFRSEYFETGFDGFTLIPRPGAQEQIEARIKDYVFRADGLLDLPEFVMDNRTVQLSKEGRKTYDTLKKDMISQIGDTPITAANAAVLFGKLKQMANGRVYDENRTVHKIHTAKADALMELVEELGDEQLLIAYEFNHDLEQLREILGEDLPYLGAGVSEKKALATVDAWNAGTIPIMAAHPASAGHGLNLQKGGAHHILWWGPTLDLDFYIQFNDRLRRQGNKARAVVVHTFVAEKTVDETAITARASKDSLQKAVLSALTAELGPIRLKSQETGETNMPPELVFQSDAQAGNPNQGNAPASPFGAFGGPQPNAAPQGQFPGFGAPQGQTQQAPAPTGFGAPQGQPQQGQAPQGFGGFGAPPQGQPAAPTGFPGMGQPTGQAQTIQQDVAAPAAPTPQQAFAAFGVGGQAPAQSDTGWQAPKQPVQDAEVVSEAPAAEKPKRGRKPKSDTPSDDSGTTDADADSVPGSWVYDHGAMIAVSLSVPAGRYAAVLAAIAQALR